MRDDIGNGMRKPVGRKGPRGLVRDVEHLNDGERTCIDIWTANVTELVLLHMVMLLMPPDERNVMIVIYARVEPSRIVGKKKICNSQITTDTKAKSTIVCQPPTAGDMQPMVRHQDKPP
jgi:hypothetical protein